MNRVCYDSWCWCQVQMPPITSVPLPNPSWQLCQYLHFSQTCLSLEGMVTAMWPPIVTDVFFLQHITVWAKTHSYCFVCIFACLIVCLSLCFDHELSETGERVEMGLGRSCSVLQQGQLWFDPVRKGLYLCDGAVWITVLEGENPTSATYFPAGLCSP